MKLTIVKVYVVVYADLQAQVGLYQLHDANATGPDYFVAQCIPSMPVVPVLPSSMHFPHLHGCEQKTCIPLASTTSHLLIAAC